MQIVYIPKRINVCSRVKKMKSIKDMGKTEY